MNQFAEAICFVHVFYPMASPTYNITWVSSSAGHFGGNRGPENFELELQVYIIKQAPLINWMQTFPTDDMKHDHVDGYCICKACGGLPAFYPCDPENAALEDVGRFGKVTGWKIIGQI